MLKALQLKGTKETPEIHLDKESNTFKLSGRSLPEDSFQFYQPILEWMKEYIKDPLPSTELVVQFDYFNSSSIKQLLIFFKLLETIVSQGKEAKIVWNYEEDDDLMEIKGKEFKRMLSVPLEITMLPA